MDNDPKEISEKSMQWYFYAIACECCKGLGIHDVKLRCSDGSYVLGNERCLKCDGNGEFIPTAEKEKTCGIL